MTKNHHKQTDGNSITLLEDARMCVDRWKRRMIGFGAALIVSIAFVVPFLEGHFLHRYFDSFGKYLIYLSMGLMIFFVGSAAFAFNFWSYWRKLKADW